MSPTPYRDILDAVAGEHMPDLDLYPRITAQLERKPLMQTLRARPIVALIIVVLTLLMLTGVAYAVNRLLGYIPGLGIVEQGTPIRVLAEPVSQTRDGITLTVTEAILSPDKTFVAFRFENVPPEGRSENGCRGIPEIHLPDGTSLEFTGGKNSNETETRLLYAAIPADVGQATFVMPCIPDALPGKLPENWELPLRFVLAPPDLTVVPVVELSISTPTPAPATTATATPASVVIEKALQVDNKLVFIGRFRPHAPAGMQLVTSEEVKIIDASGKEIPYNYPSMDLDIPPILPNQNDFGWAAEIANDNLSYPLTFTFNGAYYSEADPQATAKFEFDADHDLKPEQPWQVNRDFVLAGHRLQLVSLSVDSNNNYSFMFQCGADIGSFTVEIPGHTPTRGGGGGGCPGDYGMSMGYEQPLTGSITVVFSHLMVPSGTDTWQGQWSPEK